MTGTDHVLRNTSATLTVTFSAGAADSDAVTVTITDEAGNEVVAETAAAAAGDGAYSYQLAPQTQLNRLTVTWAGEWGGIPQTITTFVEIVGGYLFTVADARAFDDAKLADEETYPDAAIRDVRAGIADLFEQVTGVSFIARYARETLDAPAGRDLWLARRQVRTVLAASVSGTALTSDELADLELYAHGQLYRSAAWRCGFATSGRRAIVVEYEHGHETVPWDIHQAALVLARYTLVSTEVSDRTISWSNELGTFRQAVPGEKYPTGIPAVDAALGRYTRRMVLA